MSQARQFVLCIENRGYRAALEPRKVYACLPDPAAKKLGLLRVIDGSDEDYVYPAALFVPTAAPRGAVRMPPSAK
jgi:hypothetical protein